MSIALLLTLLSAALAEDAWTTAEVELIRWPAEVGVVGNPVVTTLVEATKVEVVFRKEAQVRVRKGGDFGWVPAETLSTEPPTEPADGN